MVPKLTPGLFNHILYISKLATFKRPQSSDILSNQITMRTGTLVCYPDASLIYVTVPSPLLAQKDSTVSKEGESDPDFAYFCLNCLQEAARKYRAWFLQHIQFQGMTNHLGDSFRSGVHFRDWFSCLHF